MVMVSILINSIYLFYSMLQQLRFNQNACHKILNFTRRQTASRFLFPILVCFPEFIFHDIDIYII